MNRPLIAALLICCLSACLAFPTTASADPVTADAGAGAGTEADAGAGGGDAIDWKAEALAVKQAFEAYRAAMDPTAKRLALFGLLLSLTYLLLSIWKMAAQLSRAAKRWLPWAALVAGVLVGLLTRLVADEPLLWAVVYGMGPPSSVLARELVSRFKKPDPVPA